MANIDPAPSWAPIRQLETTDRNLAGPGGVLNTQPTSIAARLNLLRDNATALNNTVVGVSSRQDSADSAIASLESQVLDAPGTLSDLDHGAPISVTGEQFPDVLSIDNSRGPVLALNESIADLAQRDEWLKAQTEALDLNLASLNVSKMTRLPFLNALRTTDHEESGEFVFVESHSLGGSSGGGIFQWDALSTATDDDGVVVQTEGVETGRWVRVLSDSTIRLSYYGITNDQDATVAMSSAISFSKANGYPTVMVDLSRVTITSALPQLNSSFDCVVITGKSSDSRRTTIDLTGAPDGILMTRGGSGVIGGVFLRDLTIRAEGKTPLYCTGFCGYTVQNVRLYASTAARLSTDIAVGTFTEFFVFKNCQIWCGRLFQVARGAGDGSFHGCGFNNGTVINKITGSTTALIELNEGDTGRAVWYNCQTDGTVFWRGTNNYLISLKNPAVTGSIINVSGFLRIERFSDGAAVLIGDSDRVFFAGSIQSLAGDTGLGAARRVEIVDYGSSGAPTGILAPILRKNTKAAGTSSLILENVRDDYFGTLLSLTITGSNYHYVYLLHILGTFNALSGVVSVVATPRSFNGAGLGATTFSMTGSRLTIAGDTSWTAATLTVSANIMPSVMNQAATG